MALEIKNRYITPDDFKIYFGIDLEAKLKEKGNPSNTASAFIMRIENRITAYVDYWSHIRVESIYDKFTDYQKEHFRLALLEQALYVFKNGDISVDSGYDYERGIVASSGDIEEKSMSKNAIKELYLCGLINRKIKGNRRIGGIWDKLI